jgi:hypothetical protein
MYVKSSVSICYCDDIKCIQVKNGLWQFSTYKNDKLLCICMWCVCVCVCAQVRVSISSYKRNHLWVTIWLDACIIMWCWIMALPLTLESTEVTIHVPPELQLNSSAFCPTSVFICFIWLNYKQQLFPYTASLFLHVSLFVAHLSTVLSSCVCHKQGYVQE